MAAIPIIWAAALLPAVLLWVYILKKDKNPEPTGELVKALLLGVATCIPAALIEFAISFILFGSSEEGSSLIGNIADAFFVAAIPEECIKLLALWLVLRKNPSFDEHFDGIVYSVCVGLGFATAENVLYLFDNMNDWASVAIGRALFSVPGHYAFAVLMGYYYARYHFVERTTTNLICILAVPVLAHGIYDAIVMNIGINEYLILPIFVLLSVFCVTIHKICKKKILAQLQMDGTA